MSPMETWVPGDKWQAALFGLTVLRPVSDWFEPDRTPRLAGFGTPVANNLSATADNGKLDMTNGKWQP